MSGNAGNEPGLFIACGREAVKEPGAPIPRTSCANKSMFTNGFRAACVLDARCTRVLYCRERLLEDDPVPHVGFSPALNVRGSRRPAIARFGFPYPGHLR